MNNKIAKNMISIMSKSSLKTSKLRNIFVIITIILASSLLTVILMFGLGQKEKTKRDLSHTQQVGYYNLTEEQVEKLKNDERIAYQIQVKTGTISQINKFDIIPYYVSELSDKIHIAELESGNLPKKENEIAVQKAMLEKLDISPEIGSEVTLNFYDGNTETFVVSGIIKGENTGNQFAVFFSKDYAINGSQLKDSPFEVYAKLYGATTMHREDCKEAMYLIGSEAGIERKYVYPSKAFLDTLSVNSQDVLTYGVIGGVILFACILVIYGVFYLSVVGRIHQFGQLRTLGMTKKQMKKFVSKEGKQLFLKSAPIGILIGAIIGYFIIPEGFSIVNTLIIIACVFVIIYIITMISITKPSKIAASVSPMEALRYVAQDTMKNKANKKVCRNLSPLGLGVMNFAKNKKKATITMLSLGLGGILFITSATYMSSFDKEAYSRQGYFKDAEFYIQYSESAQELTENGISGMQAEKPILNWLTYDSLNAQLLISTEESKEEQVGAELEALVEEKSELSLETLAETKETHNSEADRVFGAISGLAIFIMMFSILSMINTLITNIVTRKQELAMLESIGMSKSQIRKMLLGESLLLVVATVGITMTIGVLCGYFLSNMLYNNGMYYMVFKFPIIFALAYVIVLTLVPLVITIASMKTFAKESLVERLRGTEC